MQRDSDRDRAIEHVLRQVSAAAPADVRACIDGETLAAWSEGQLRGADADAIERHLSTCARCQQLLATFARTAPPPVVQVPLWRRWRLQWLLPIATAATVAAIFVATPQEEREAYVAAPRPSQATPAPESAPVPPAALPQAASADPGQRRKSDTSSPRDNQPNDPDRTAFSRRYRATAPEREELKDRADEARPLGDLQKSQQAPATAAEADAGARDVAGLRAQAESTPAAKVPEAAAAAAAPRAEAPQAPPSSTSEARQRSAQGGAIAGFTARQAVALIEIVSPNPANRWRIIGAQVERTTNSGMRWEAVTLPSTAQLTAGMSPAPSVCWIVGRGGAIYLTIDGSRFIRIAFPETLDLVSVTATDDQRATVTSADGRTFTTADRGVTWVVARP